MNKRKSGNKSQASLMSFLGKYSTKRPKITTTLPSKVEKASMLFIPELILGATPTVEAKKIDNSPPQKQSPESGDKKSYYSSDPLGTQETSLQKNPSFENFILPAKPNKRTIPTIMGKKEPSKPQHRRGNSSTTKGRRSPPRSPSSGSPVKENVAIANRPSLYPWLRNKRDVNKRFPNDPKYDPTTLYIPPSDFERLSDFEKQYWGIKKNHMQTIIFFKKGKFYEIYEEDSELTNRLFDLKCTESRNMRMTGVPHTHGQFWAAKLLAKGYKVGIVDQVETSAAHNRTSGKGVLKRELKHVLTAGTVTDPLLIGTSGQVPLLSVFEVGKGEEATLGICILEAAEANIYLTTLNDDRMRTRLDSLLLSLRPKEVVFPRGGLGATSMALLRKCISDPLRVALPAKSFPETFHSASDTIQAKNYFNDEDAQQLLFDRLKSPDASLMALIGLISYLESLKLAESILPACYVRDVVPEFSHMIIDGSTLTGINVFSDDAANAKRGKKISGRPQSLLELLNYCSTDFGFRLLKEWIAHPLSGISEIEKRQQAIGEVMDKISSFLDKAIPIMRELPDLSRSLCRIQSKTISEIHLQQAMKGFDSLLRLHEIIEEIGVSSEIVRSCSEYKSLEGPLESVRRWFKKGNFSGAFEVPEGYDSEYDMNTRALEDLLGEFEHNKRSYERSMGVNLKFKDMGKERYQLEVPSRTRLPEDAIVKSQTKSVVRFWTPFIQQSLVKVLDYEDKIQEKKSRIFHDILIYVAKYYGVFRRSVDRVATLDCLLSLAMASESLVEDGPVCKPRFVPHRCLRFKNLRHPFSNIEEFIPNDTIMGDKAPLMVLTGPNMGGKTTLLRQISIGVIMAHIGCLVSAEECTLSLVDKLFTRIGSSDDILSGRSTFMVEMQETSHILQNVTPQSLVLLDELGRGTATFDGYAIAGAVLDSLRDVSCLTIVSTHYHLLAQKLGMQSDVVTGHMGYDEANSVFLYKLLPGICPKSHGMVVARLAGIPEDIVAEAADIAERFENSSRISGYEAKVASQSNLDNYESLEIAVSNGRLGVIQMLLGRV